MLVPKPIMQNLSLADRLDPTVPETSKHGFCTNTPHQVHSLTSVCDNSTHAVVHAALASMTLICVISLAKHDKASKSAAAAESAIGICSSLRTPLCFLNACHALIQALPHFCYACLHTLHAYSAAACPNSAKEVSLSSSASNQS